MKFNTSKKWAFGFIGGVVSLVAITTSVYTVPTGEVVIVKRLGKIIDESTSGGPYFKVPLVDTITSMNVQTWDNTIATKAHSFDQQELSVTVSVQWSVAPESRVKSVNPQDSNSRDILIGDASRILASYGSRSDFDKIVLDRKITESTNDMVAQKTLSAIVQNRAAFNEELKQRLVGVLKGYPITIDGIQIVSLQTSAAYSEAIEAKQVASVAVQTAEQKAQSTRINADAEAYARQKAADAEAYAKTATYNAEAQGIKAVSAQLHDVGDLYVRYTWAKSWNGQTPTYVGSGAGFDTGVGMGVGSSATTK